MQSLIRNLLIPTLLLILSFCCIACQSPKNVNNQAVKELSNDTAESRLEYTTHKNGLSFSIAGDIGIKAFEKVWDDSYNYEVCEIYINRIYTENEVTDGGPQYLKNVVDTATFQILEEGYYKDKANVYLTPTSDGGTLKILANADPNSFRTFGKEELATDLFTFYQHGQKISKQEYYKYTDDTLR